MPSIGTTNIVNDAISSVWHNIPWYFWLLIIIVGIVKIMAETTPKKRKHQRYDAIFGNPNPPQPSFNAKLMPCPDCGKTVSLNAASCPHCGAPITPEYVNEVKSKRDLQRRKQQKEADVFSVRGSNGCVLIVLVVFFCLVLKFISGILMWVLAGLLSLLILAGLYETFRLRDKGKLGEEIVRQKLANRLPKETYRVLNDIFLPLENGGTTQIDHVVVSIFGVFVVETKNYSGWIFADKNSPSWTQVLGNAKNHFQNPIRQNYLHLCAIADNLGLPKDILHGIVAFADDCEFKTERPKGVVLFNELPAYIQRFGESIITQSEVADIVSAIREWNASITPAQRASHVENLEKRYSSGARPSK